MALYEFKPFGTSQEKCEQGTIEWAEAVSRRLQLEVSELSRGTAARTAKQIKLIFSAKPQPWDYWPDPPFNTPDDYCKAVTGHDWTTLCGLVAELTDDPELKDVRRMQGVLARAQVEHRSQGVRTDQHVYNINKLKRGGTSAGYLLRRLARDHKEFLAAYERGEYRSVRAAAKAAGIKLVTRCPKCGHEW